MSCIKNIDLFIIPGDVIVQIANIYRYIGSNSRLQEIAGNNVNKVITQTIERDAFFLAKILKLDVTDTRMRLIITKDSQPRNKEETALYNIKETLTLYQNNYEKTLFQSNDLLNLANYIFSSNIKFDFANSEKKHYLKSQAQTNKRVILDEINENLQIKEHNKTIEKISLYLNYFVDFYNINPLTQNNEAIGLLLLYLLCLKCDLESFKYISFFEMLYDKYEQFKLELNNASINWKEGFPQVVNFIRFMLALFDDSYKKAIRILKDFRFDQSINKADNLENTIMNMTETFAKEDIRILHPYVSESTINRALKKLKDEKKIKPLGKGRSAKWIRLYKGYNYD
ncbi:MAG TPA: hypothetical protein GX695_01730 [Acholeplasmataceae bacterium]|nr:hypothetical protein [Acholeplasmataceae bacterium]